MAKVSQIMVHGFGFLLSLEELEEKFCKREGEVKEESKAAKKTSRNYVHPDVQTFLTEHKGLDKQDVLENPVLGDPTHILIYDSNFQITCPPGDVAFMHNVYFGFGIESMMKKIEETLKKRGDFIEARKFFGVEPEWHTVFTREV